MVKSLYLMRHGQTRLNAAGKVQGAYDAPLTEAGIEQAGLARAFLNREQIVPDLVYSSTQERAADTAELVTGREPKRLKGLKEMDFGSFEGKDEFLLPKIRPKAKSFEDLLVPYGGEDIRDVGGRVTKTLNQILDDMDNSQIALAVSHGAAMWGYFLVNGFHLPDGIFFNNCSICQFIKEDEQLRFIRFIDVINNKIYDLENKG